MKKVIFVCLLTLSVCLSDSTVKPVNPPKTGNETPAPAPADAHKPPPSAATQGTSANQTSSKEPENAAQNANGTTPVPAKGTTNSTSAATNGTSATTNGTSVPTNGTTNHTTEGKPDNSTTTTLKPAVHNDTTTEKPKVPTEAPHATTEKPNTLQGRRFDGASFVGGIILTLGLLAIGFMGFKYYKAQTERNYHTL